MKTKIDNLREIIKNRNGYYFNQIQAILDEKEKGNIKIDLDILYKINHNCREECLNILRELNKLFPEEIKGLKK